MSAAGSHDVMPEHVRNILLWHDPMHIVVKGDEHVLEVERILGALDATGSEQDVAHMMRAIFVEMSDGTAAGPIDRYVAMGKEIRQAHTSAA